MGPVRGGERRRKRGKGTVPVNLVLNISVFIAAEKEGGPRRGSKGREEGKRKDEPRPQVKFL